MILRRLSPETDIDLLRLAYEWIANAPAWFLEIEQQFGAADFDEFLQQAQSEQQKDIGLFDGGLCALITLVQNSGEIYEAHLRIRKGCPLEKVIHGALMIRHQLFRDMGATEIFGQIPSFHKSATRLAEQCGLYRDGLTVIQGQVRQRLIEWVRVSCHRWQWELENGKEETGNNKYLHANHAAEHAGHTGMARLETAV
jgi:hypothetical protein